MKRLFDRLMCCFHTLGSRVNILGGPFKGIKTFTRLTSPTLWIVVFISQGGIWISLTLLSLKKIQSLKFSKNCSLMGCIWMLVRRFYASGGNSYKSQINRCLVRKKGEKLNTYGGKKTGWNYLWRCVSAEASHLGGWWSQLLPNDVILLHPYWHI